MCDIKVENHGSIFLFYPNSESGSAWIEENVSDEAQWLDGALVVEHRYAWDLAQGMLDAGLEVA